jgi:hypothetical protein
MTTQRRYANAAVGTANVNIGIPSGNTVAMTAASFCNKANAPVAVNLWLQPATGANTSYLNSTSIPANSTLVVFGSDQKQFILTGDTVWANCNVAGGFDLIISTVEGI